MYSKWLCRVSKVYVWSFHDLTILFCNLLNKEKKQRPKPLVISHGYSACHGCCFRDPTICMLSPRHHSWRTNSTCTGLWTASYGKFIGWGSTGLHLPFPGSLSARRQLCPERHQKAGLQGNYAHCDPGWDCPLQGKFHVCCRSVDMNVHLLLFYINLDDSLY